MANVAVVPSQKGTGVAAGATRRRQWELDALRLMAICGVVAIHVVGMMLGNDHLTGGRQWWAAVTIDLGLVWVVPVFVMISGALVLSPRAHAAGPAEFWRKRFVRVGPALVVWHLIYLFGARAWLKGEELNRGTVIAWLLDGKVYTALYFLWLIAGLYLVAPLIAAFLHSGGRRRSAVTAAATLGFTVAVFAASGLAALNGTPRPIALGALTMWLPYVGYFVAGWALHRVVLPAWGVALAVAGAAVSLAEVVWQYGHKPAYPALQQLVPTSYLGAGTAVAAVCVMLAATGLGARVTPGPRLGRLLRRLADATFGVFLVHLLIFEVVRRLVPAVAEASSLVVMLAAWAFVVVASFAVSLVAARIPVVRAVF
ncbi:acyltransferase [Actinoplanes sp. NPDC049265]|uniref:acyltransferase n=1 Tax=Actinoplanes sp. NPDC049265 TaxID=3363902 RepID=UPI003710F9DA